MAKRKGNKTVDVETLVKFANFNLARKDDFANVGYKTGICDFVEKVLMESGNYKGFMFIDNNDSAFGTLGYFSRMYFLI